MKIEIPDDIAKKLNFNEQSLKEFVAVSLYKKKMINGVEGGRWMGTSEIEFHGLLEKFDDHINYNIDDYLQDSNNLKDL